jgi:energy-coupling factor transporter ATP-binding protein EcfA2
MPGLKGGGIRYEHFSPFVNLIVGSNGSGKTTTCLAVRKLLWPEHATVKRLSPVSLLSQWEGGQIRVEGERCSSFWEGAQTLAVAEPYAFCYTILLQDLFGEEDRAFASVIAREAFGGCDLPALRERFALSSRMGGSEQRALAEKRAQWRKVADAHAALQRQEEGLSRLSYSIEQARQARACAERMRRGQELRRAQERLTLLEEKLNRFPAGVVHARADDERLFERLASEERALFCELEEAQGEIYFSGDATELEALAEVLEKLKRLDQEIEAAERQTSQAHAASEAFASFRDATLCGLGRSCEQWYRWHEAVCSLHAIEAQQRDYAASSLPIRGALAAIPLLGAGAFWLGGPLRGGLLWALLVLPAGYALWQLRRKKPALAEKRAALEREVSVLSAGVPQAHLLAFVEEARRAVQAQAQAREAEEELTRLKRERGRVCLEQGFASQEDTAVLMRRLKKTQEARATSSYASKALLEKRRDIQEMLARCRILSQEREAQREELRALLTQLSAYETCLKDKAQAEAVVENLRGEEYALEGDLEACERIAASYEELVHEKGRIEGEIEAAGRSSTFEEARAAVLEAEKQVAGCRKEMAARAVALFLLREAENLFERETQPEILKRARSWLLRFTHGRHDLGLTASSENGSCFFAVDTASRERKLLTELSCGTRLQVLLAVRLAFLDAVESGDPLPLLLDEVLSHSDDARFRVIAESLTEAARQGRQIFYFTCQRRSVQAYLETLSPEERACVRVIDLDQEVRAQALPYAACAEGLFVPQPEDRSLAAYAALLQASAIDPFCPPGACHIAHLVDTPLELYRYASQHILSYGQFKALEQKGIVQHPRLRAKGSLLEEFHRLWKVGRGRKVTREDLVAGGVSERFIDPVHACSQRVGGDARALLAALADRAVSGFREKTREALAGHLRACGCLDEEAPLSEEELLARVWRTSSLNEEDTAVFLQTLTHQFFLIDRSAECLA